MRTKYSLIATFFSMLMVSLCTITFAQGTTVSGSSISVDKDIFEALVTWSAEGESQRKSMSDYLNERFDADRLDVVLESFEATSDERMGSCVCNVVTPNVTFDLSPSTLSTSTHNDHSGNNWFWDRQFSKTREGAAHKDVLDLRGKHKSTSYTHTTSGSKNASSTYTSFDVLWICSSGGFPSYCGCDKLIELDAKYESNLRVHTQTGGPWTKAAYASAEEIGTIISYDWDVDPNNLVNSVVVHSVGHDGLSAATSTTWQPAAFVGILDLAATIGGVIISGTFTAAQLTSITTKLSAVITGPPIITKFNSSGGITQSSVFTTQTASVLVLKPNVRKTVSIISNGHLYGRGYGGDWDAEASVSSDYNLAIVIPFDDSKPNCCIEQVAAWDAKSMSGSPNSLTTLKSTMKSFINARTIPGVAWGPDWMTSSMDLSLYPNGYIDDLLTTHHGRSSTSNCKPYTGGGIIVVGGYLDGIHMHAEVEFFPYNPIINIGINDLQTGQVAVLETFNNTPVSPYNVVFDLSGFAPGLYEVFATGLDGTVETMDFVYEPPFDVTIDISTDPEQGMATVKVEYMDTDADYLQITDLQTGEEVIFEDLTGNTSNSFVQDYLLAPFQSGMYQIAVTMVSGNTEAVDFYWDNPVGVRVSTFPNPSYGLTSVTLENETNEKLESITILKLQTGEVISFQEIPEGISYPFRSNFDLTQYPSGVYQIIVRSRSGERYSKSMIVQQ